MTSRQLLGPSAAVGGALALLALFVVLVLTAGARKSETVDEGLFIAGGAVQAATGNPNFDLSHPPLLRWVTGIPVRFVARANIPEPVPFVPYGAMELAGLKLDHEFGYGQRFFYEAGNDPRRMLFWGRFPFAFIGALLGWMIFVSARRAYGAWPALGAVALYAFTPEVLAHAQWAHSDLASAATIFLVAIAFARALASLAWRDHLLLALAMGLAVATKLTALVLWPFLIIALALVHRGQWRALAGRTAVVLAVFSATIAVSYLPEPRLGTHAFVASDLEAAGLTRWEPVLSRVPLPDTFLKGALYTKLLTSRGQIGYFHGSTSIHGWWYYYPAAIFLKYPTTTLLLAAAGLLLFLRAGHPLAVKVAFTIPPLVLLAAAMSQSVNIGVRSVLPIAPFLALWSGAALAAVARNRWRTLAMVALALSVISGAAAYPNFLTYFNPLMGGTRAADRWLVDSNLDWGQDLPALAAELERRGVEEVRLAYFGLGRPEHYGIRALDPTVVAPGWYAISRSYLSGWWPPGDPYRWLRGREPVAVPGGSIALFHVTDVPAAESDPVEVLMRRGLAELYADANPTAAVETFRAVLGLHPSHYGATFQLASALDRAGRREEAVYLWLRMLELAEVANDEGTLTTVRARLAEP